jgi:hypothetical protein
MRVLPSLGFLDLFREACNARIPVKKQPEKNGFFREYADLSVSGSIESKHNDD